MWVVRRTCHPRGPGYADEVWTYWRRLPSVSQDLLLAAVIAAGWFAGLAALVNSRVRPENTDASIVAGIFLVLTVAVVRRFPTEWLVVTSVLYPVVYAAAAIGVFAGFGVEEVGRSLVSSAALQSELHLVPLLVAGYLAAAVASGW